MSLFDQLRDDTEAIAATRAQAESHRPSAGQIFLGDCVQVLKRFEDERFQMCVTSPPYWGLRDYGIQGQIGAEVKIDDYVAALVNVFREIRRVLAKDGTVWLNLGDSYTSGGRTWRQTDKKNRARAMDYRAPTPEGLKPKDLIGVPWRVAFALQADGWWLRSDLIWHKPNAHPESVKDRPARVHEYLFLLSKSQDYFYDWRAVRECATGPDGGKRNRRSVWSINTEPFADAHFATFPPALVAPCLQAGSRPGSEVLDPFFGSGTMAEVCVNLGRRFVGIELNEDYAQVARRRLMKRCGLQVPIIPIEP
jgi:site-specific DNA-methyltransferase (adenine-specific)/site-specific DNA-methyltransferase (cytosine-N4-specific)